MRFVIFDVDGTLVDSQHEIVEAQTRAFAAHGLPAPTRARALSVVGLSLIEAFKVLAGPDGPVEALARSYKEAWRVLRSRPAYQDRLYTGAAELVDDLRGRPDVRLAIATGKSRQGVDRILAAQGWEQAFVSIQTADTHPSKPHPSMILAAMREFGAAPEETTMVGDTTFDIGMAVAAGVTPVGVGWGYHDPADLRAAGAALVADDFDALRRALGVAARVAA